MERQTRQLLETLSDDLTNRILEELTEGEALETELQRRIPSSRQTIGRRLAELELWGVIAGDDRHTPGRGRPTRAWRLTSPEVAAFLLEADELLLRLLERRAQRHREALNPAPEHDRVRRLRS
jgi:predicted ArsR family transcriptional regulator